MQACLADFVLDIQYIGSTAVPGLPAKPILDIWQRTIAFRDALRKRPDRLQAYASLKQELAQRYPHDLAAYTVGKSVFIEQGLHEADVGSTDDVSV